MEKDAKTTIKTYSFNFNQIERYFLMAPTDEDLQPVSDRTFSDLDLEDVFQFIDHAA